MIAQPRGLRPGRSGPRKNTQVVRRHFGYVPYGHIHGYASALLHKQDGYFEQAPASRATFALALLIGLWKNGLQAGRFWKEVVVHTRFASVPSPTPQQWVSLSEAAAGFGGVGLWPAGTTSGRPAE